MSGHHFGAVLTRFFNTFAPKPTSKPFPDHRKPSLFHHRFLIKVFLDRFKTRSQNRSQNIATHPISEHLFDQSLICECSNIRSQNRCQNTTTHPILEHLFHQSIICKCSDNRSPNQSQTTKKHHFSHHFLTPSIEYECSKTRSQGALTPRARAENIDESTPPMGCGTPTPHPQSLAGRAFSGPKS